VTQKIKMPIEATHIMMFARSIGDQNPIYYDAKYAENRDTQGIIAPPTFARAFVQFNPDYELRPNPNEKWFGSGKTPTGIGTESKTSGGLHAEQHFEYHRQLKPGDQLSVRSKQGKQWEKDSKRAGRLKFVETIQEFRDQNEQLVITMRSVVVHTEKTVEEK
jgi:acyl dehydratase